MQGQSRADFMNKLHIVEEECDESIYWMKLIRELEYGDKGNIRKYIRS